MNHKRKKPRVTSRTRSRVVGGWCRGNHKRSVNIYYSENNNCKIKLKQLTKIV